MPDTIEVTQSYAPYSELAELPIWQTFVLVPKKKGKGFDKIPNNGYGNIPTTAVKRWITLAEALAAKELYGLPGVTLNLAGGVEDGQWRLVGLDFDGVNFDHFALPFDTYAELSPSGTGIRAFCWVPTAWAVQYQDTTDLHPSGCDHMEAYIGTSARHLTVTGVAINDYPIARLESLGSLQLNRLVPKVDAGAPEINVGTELALASYGLSADQTHLIHGTGELDRSAVMHGLIIKLVDAGAPNEDILATITKTPALWQYCLDHRHEDPTRALQFAREEIGRAYARSVTGMRENLLGFNRKPPPKVTLDKTVAFPPPFPGPMTDIVTACLEVSRKPQPVLALGAALSAMAAACGSYFAHQDGGRLNLYALGVARTGTGKDAALRCARHIGRMSKAKIIGKPASGQGLEDALASNIATYCVVDEIAHFFSLMNGANAKSYELANASMILELWSAGRDAHHTREKVGKDSTKIDHPAFNLLGFTTPEKLGNAFTPDDFADGLAGRIYFFISDEDPKARRVKNPMRLPASFKKALAEVDRGLHFVLFRGGTEIGLTDEADALIDVLLDEFDEQSRATDSPYDRALCSRSMEKLERVAGVLAVWDSPAQPTITAEHLQWAAQLTRASNAAVLGFVDEYMHGGVEQDNAAKLLRMIKDGKTKPDSTSERAATKAGWTPRSALLRRAKMSVDKEFNPAIRLLVGCGEVVEGKVGDLLVLGLKGDE